jgi:ribosomal protein L11 methyltransferase
MADYLELTCRLPPEHEERLGEVLEAAPVLGAQVLESDENWIRLAVYLDGSGLDHAVRVQQALSAAGARDVAVRPFEACDWLAGWRQSALAFEVGERWWIDPHPDAASSAPDGRVRLAVEPRTAFGSGTHESTRLVLEELETLQVAGRRVLDIGTGSGILAIAAERLGAGMVVAFDVDPEALWVARRTATEQDWPARPLLFAGTMQAVRGRGFDIVLCNMITEQLRPLLPAVRQALSATGLAVLSGTLGSELAGWRVDLASAGFVVRRERHLGEWCSVTVASDGG